MQQEFIKASALAESGALKAPVAGYVQQLAVHTVGGVVTQAQPLMIIVPANATLEVEAQLANKDIGFVSTSMSAEVKIDAFPFTRYGTIPGTVQSISSDAMEMQNVGWVYNTRIELSKSSLKVDGKEVSIAPGMSVAVEIKTGKRRLVEFVLSPLLRYRDESVRER